MSILTVGKVRPTYKGNWTSSAIYEALDWVTYRGFAFQAIIEVPANREPDVNPTYWVQTGMKGDKGEAGEAGAPGPAGVDGRDGAEGKQGPQGPAPQHRWAKSALGFQNPDGTWAEAVDLQGPKGPKGDRGGLNKCEILTTSTTWIVPKTDWYKITVIAGGGGGGQGGPWSCGEEKAFGKGGGAGGDSTFGTSADVHYVTAEGGGGGGGGGGSSGGGGGGAGQVFEKYMNLTAGASINCIIGSGGTGGKTTISSEGLPQAQGVGGGRTGGKVGTFKGCGGGGGKPGGSSSDRGGAAGRCQSGENGTHPSFIDKFTGSSVVTPFKGLITGSGGQGGSTGLGFGGGGGGGAGSRMLSNECGLPGNGADGGCEGLFGTTKNAGAFGGDGGAGAIFIEYDAVA